MHGGILDGQPAAEVPQLNQARGLRIFDSEPSQGGVNIEKIVRSRGTANIGIVEGYTP